MTNRHTILIAVSLIIWGVMAAPAIATPTDICNAWNADVTEEGNIRLYTWADWGNSGYDDGHFIGFSYGVMGWFEVGGNWRLTEDEDFRDDPWLDAKFRYSLDEETTSAVAIGVDNVYISDEDDHDIIPYVVVTWDWEGMRTTAGYQFQDENTGFFAGMDSDVGDAVVKWDWMQTNDGDDWMSAVGFEMPFQMFYLDGWKLCSFLTWGSNSHASDVWNVEVSYEF